MKTLRSARLTLSELLPVDITEEYLSSLNDVEYMRFSRNSNFTHTFKSQLLYLAKFNGTSSLLFALKDIAKKELVGTLNCYVDFQKMTLDLGFLIFKKHGGKGFASEALGILIPFLESQYPGMTVIIGTDKNNFAMHKIANKHNFKLEVESRHLSNLKFIRTLPKLSSDSQPMLPELILNARTIGVVVYDAGGAEQVSWILRQLPQEILVCLDGPARRVFENSGIVFKEVRSVKDLMNCDLIITGSGWMSELEQTAIREARSEKVPCLTVLDHWINYRDRFGHEEASHPQALGVTNVLALRIAQNLFSDLVVWLLPDFQIENYKETINSKHSPADSVLLILEPFSESDSKFSFNVEKFQKLLSKAIFFKKTRALPRIVIRLHPSQVLSQSFLDNLAKLPYDVEVSKSAILIEDLVRSGVVLGLNSYALYISAMCGIDTYSFFADSDDHWTKEFPVISSLSSIS